MVATVPGRAAGAAWAVLDSDAEAELRIELRSGLERAEQAGWAGRTVREGRSEAYEDVAGHTQIEAAVRQDGCRIAEVRGSAAVRLLAGEPTEPAHGRGQIEYRSGEVCAERVLGQWWAAQVLPVVRESAGSGVA